MHIINSRGSSYWVSCDEPTVDAKC